MPVFSYLYCPEFRRELMWNFDEAVPRENTDCIKYDKRKEVFGNPDVIPMWVADMDFRTPPCVTEAIKDRLNHEIFGYSFRPDSYFESFIRWVKNRHDWTISQEWIEFSPGVVPALNLCTLAFTDKGDEIIIQPPVYTPFHAAVTDHGRKLIYNNLIERDGRWTMDYNGLRSLISPSTKMITISNPHNPVGRAWTSEELEELVEVCYGKGIVILSDEIHSDLILEGHKHIPVASLSEKAASITVTCMAPSKTFNLAGLSTSSVIISDPVLREKYKKVLVGMHLHLGNLFGNIASEAAYTHGAEWLTTMLAYVKGNAELVMSFCNQHLPEIKPVMPEATYMMWLDCRQMKMNGAELQRFFVEEAGVGMNEGSAFGPGGEGFMRINLACPKSTVQAALNKIKEAYKRKSKNG